MKKVNGFKNEMRLEFLSKSSNESFARVAVAAFASQIESITLEEVADIKTAVSEAVTNAIIHGYEGQLGYVSVLAQLYDNEIVIEVSDKGKGIENVTQAMQPLYTSKPELERSGMGFTVMETFMNEVEVTSAVGQGTLIRMIKKFQNDDGEMGRG